MKPPITRKPRVSARRPVAPSGYAVILADTKQAIAAAQRRSMSLVNRELVFLYWTIGRTIVLQQECRAWGDAVVARFSRDLRAAFPEMRGLSLPNLWRMRHFFLACRQISLWKQSTGSLPGQRGPTIPDDVPILSTLSRELGSRELASSVLAVSWSHHTLICSATGEPAEQYFYLLAAARERWSVRELERQIESGLFLRYMSVAREPEKCLPEARDQGPLLPFRDHYVLDFLGLEATHTEQQLRRAMLANVRELFLEFGREFTLVGEEYPVAVGDDTYRVDLLLFHRGLQCLVAIELKAGEFKPEHVGKCQFYLAALDEYVRLQHEKPSIGLILCKSARGLQMKLALTLAARRVGVATYQTALPDERLIRERLESLSCAAGATRAPDAESPPSASAEGGSV
jgi:predicted nuclease of restriction endonuclease-like (RecB) superfamily